MEFALIYSPRKDRICFSCRRSSVVERTLGKGEVTGSNPVGGFGIMRYCRRSAVAKKMVSVDDRRTNWLGR